MSDEALTFSELRKIQKQEKRQDDLTELQDRFLLQVSSYLKMKKDSGDEREYRSAKRVFDKIIGLRQQKIVKKARLAVKTGNTASQLNLLPREQQLFRDFKKRFKEYFNEVDDVLEKQETELEQQKETQEQQNNEEETEEQDEDQNDGFKKVEMVSDVPEFMGTDLESYGPFEEGEEAEIPEENAEILVNRGSAEMIE
ncbi:MAG: hypothetical protein ABEJ83_03795 [Candidatus Nanohaloarchaea archaeon]